MTTRTQDEIVARIRDHEQNGGDFFGFACELLIDALDFEHAKPWLKEETTAEQWDESRTVDTETAARGYLEFALGKIDGHRGISASRSVDKLREFAWLLGRDEVLAAMDAAGYQQYGAPKVKAFAVGMGWPWPSDDAEMERMAQGLPCVDDCSGGCGQ